MAEEQINGVFLDSLIRNNKQIRNDRAEAIGEDAQLHYRRKVEDLQYQIKRMRRERDAMLDLSPTNAQSLILATDFNSEGFVEKDLKIGINLRNLEIKLEIATARYALLFGGYYNG